MQELYAVTGAVYEDIHIAVVGVMAHSIGEDTAESMETFAHISRTVMIGVLCLRPLVPVNEGTGTKDPMWGSSINSPWADLPDNCSAA